MIKVAVAGANGRMGKLLVQAINEDREVELVFELNRTNQQTLLEQRTKVDVLIDFTLPGATLQHCAIACELGSGLVIGTTGITEAMKQEIQHFSKEIPILLSPNMSIGMNLTYKVLETLSTMLRENVDVGIMDIHHRHKKDAPSGTAIRMAEVIREAGPNGLSDIQFSSLRLGDAVGEHSAIFSLGNEQIEITHRAFSRDTFAKGALTAAKWLSSQRPGLYDMQDVLKLLH